MKFVLGILVGVLMMITVSIVHGAEYSNENSYEPAVVEPEPEKEKYKEPESEEKPDNIIYKKMVQEECAEKGNCEEDVPKNFRYWHIRTTNGNDVKCKTFRIIEGGLLIVDNDSMLYGYDYGVAFPLEEIRRIEEKRGTSAKAVKAGEDN